ncbi:MAG: hypothetical protein UX09_C0026G0006 [Candidatus Uhrbacteria bacterium GW2011_GWE2_45_35]|uniref:Uncharacterized protein n=2 Tax=Candidatus Uhriibacteriota TaxID=1752732 RepID=A0A0G1JJR3_9BACT|nr:MAG: hypothetical protein UW63_C0012G0007 [Candidatus Uhrbacteria bacterium GW2011_GWF2_44_350]KKU07655.1 MAG: hypothetical protein UX09_C0026G0006 [Candidatus Uhrbacteria bacterium GW2011_GWE2_45_35]HBR80066.1 hypothetical protein [Candidatus Uhrbacteria bacterium]HCU31238.1 hypothetical protein [Candidatus Uhrbacteria bacterium]
MSRQEIDEIEAAGMCQHGNFLATCETCKIDSARPPEKVLIKEKPEALSEKEKHERKKALQVKIIKEWAGQQTPSLTEGRDFFFITDFRSAVAEGENVSPHEETHLYFGFRRDAFLKIKKFFEKEYLAAMNTARETEGEIFSPWAKREVSFNFSWGGRFMVEQAAGGIPVDSVPVEFRDGRPEMRTHHGEFKNFFAEKTGFEFPKPEELDTVLLQLSRSEPWYRAAIRMCEDKMKKLESLLPEDQDRLLPKGGWDALPHFSSLVYTIKICENARNSKKWSDGKYFRDIPEVVVDLPEQIRHFNDFTYNADDWTSLEKVAAFVGEELQAAGFPKLPPAEGRIDRIFSLVGKLRGDDKMQNFDRHQLEKIESEFSEKLYGEPVQE